MCTYNYLDSTAQRPIWTTGTLSRTTWEDSSVFGLPHATILMQVMIHLMMLLEILKELQYTMNTKQERSS